MNDPLIRDEITRIGENPSLMADAIADALVYAEGAGKNCDQPRHDRAVELASVLTYIWKDWTLGRAQTLLERRIAVAVDAAVQDAALANVAEAA